ncbi:hypothetical protein AaE_011625 [Aphanomyces astaci]|uniref:No apical meristem-associated C-terminal domain-containing protein n=1 Tax=Aphanomyces astaci TaxID=112090 RepID=A0A6A4ZXC3_APHAT|nr:hypothetical protein AaE_011625 [Aphanomyces astaci]
MEKLTVDLQLQPPHMTNTSEPTPSKKLGRGKAWKDDESVNLETIRRDDRTKRQYRSYGEGNSKSVGQDAGADQSVYWRACDDRRSEHLYKRMHKDDFEYVNSWHALKRYGDKWQAIASPSALKYERSQAKGSPNELCDTEGGDDPDQHDRPLGTKSAKRAKLVQCADDDRRARSIEVKEALVKSQVHRNKLIEEQNLLALITMTAPPGDEVAAKILDLKKRQALRMLEEDSFET